MNLALQFIENLKHTGDFYGQSFGVRPWQREIIEKIFDEDGNTRYRKVFIALPRKQGKTELAAAINVFLMAGRGRRQQRIYSASGDREQASLIYRASRDMVLQSPALRKRLVCYDGYKKIKYMVAGNEYLALSSDAPTKHGLRPNTVLLDELHVFPNRDLYNVLMSSFGATIEPFTFMITTAGWDRQSLCYELWQYALGVKQGLIDDPSFLPIIHAADASDDWTNEDTWHKAMPGLGDFCQLDFIREECLRAQKLPAYENTFRQLYLNQWTEQAERWISYETWDRCGGFFAPADMVGKECYGGLDLGVTGDMSCYWMLFPGGDRPRLLGHGFAPRDGKWRDEPVNRDRYLAWERQGYLTLTPGNVTDHDFIEREIVRWSEKYPLIKMFADRAFATQILIRLANEHRLPVEGIPQGARTLNEACVRFEELVLSGDLEHGSNPILDWAIQNASLKRNTTGLVYPDKSSASQRIDALSAAINATAAWCSDGDYRGPSVYESHGLEILGRG